MNNLLLLFLISCAQVTSLNLKKHKFGVPPKKIIWIQIAGLGTQHLALLKYAAKDASLITHFEDFLCYGESWQYNQYQIRPKVEAAFVQQYTGKSNVKNSCEDYSLKPIWKYLGELGYKVGMLSTSNRSIGECSKSFYQPLTRWVMGRAPTQKSKLFHNEDEQEYKASTVYYDKACSSGSCYSNISKNVSTTFNTLVKNKDRFVYIAEDRSYAEALDQKDILEAKSILIELNSVVGMLKKYTSKHEDALLLVTSSNTKTLSFPVKGDKWGELNKSGVGIQFGNTDLMSPVYATGARSENFCGIYSQSDILNRLFSGAKGQGLKLQFINPFK